MQRPYNDEYTPAPRPAVRSVPPSMAGTPLPRSWIDTTLPGARVLFGLLFVVYSAVSTIILFAEDIRRLTGDRAGFIIPDRFWFGIGLAALIFLGELYTSERYPRVYALFLVPDTLYSARLMQPWLLTLFVAYLDWHPLLLMFLTWIASGILGYWSARLGEELLFGKRRKL